MELRALSHAVFRQVETLTLNEALGQVLETDGALNRYLEPTAPWLRIKAGKYNQAATSLYYATERLRLVLPERMAELWRRWGWEPPVTLGTGLTWGTLQLGRHSSHARYRKLRAGQTSNRSWRGGATRLRSIVSVSPERGPGWPPQRTSMISPAWISMAVITPGTRALPVLK